MVKAEGIKKRYGKKVILEDINFRLECGQAAAIVGRNGCGKTTLMQILAGIMKPDHGEITYFGQKAERNKKIFQQFCGYVPQENPLMEELTVRDNLILWGGRNNPNLEQIIEEFKLEEMMTKPVEKLSGGMKRRLSIACGVMKQPKVLLMDEPTTALDLYYKESIHDWMSQYIKKDGIIIMTTHDEEEIQLCDKCLIMNEGKLTTLEKNDISMETIKKYMSAY